MNEIIIKGLIEPLVTENSIYIDLCLPALWGQSKQVELPHGLVRCYPPIVNPWRWKGLIALVSV